MTPKACHCARNTLSGMLLFLLVGFSMTGCGSSPEADGSIFLSASVEAIPADGSSSAIIEATVTGSNGEPAARGTGVRFTTTLGRFADGSRSLGTVVDSEDGTVTVALIADYEDGIATVTAEANDVTQSISIQIGEPGSVVGSITLVASPTTIPADGVSSSTITATLYQINGTPVKAGTYLTLTTTLGRFLNGGQVIQVPTIDDTGVIAIALVSSTTQGTATVTAFANDVSQKVQVFMGVGSETILLTTDPPNGEIPADGASSMTITAIIYDRDGTPILVGSPVTFTTTDGDFQNGERTITVPAAEGGTTVTLTSSTNVRRVVVTCSALGMSESITVHFVEPETEDEQ